VWRAPENRLDLTPGVLFDEFVTVKMERKKDERHACMCMCLGGNVQISTGSDFMREGEGA
jgi:hypothetical protein